MLEPVKRLATTKEEIAKAKRTVDFWQHWVDKINSDPERVKKHGKMELVSVTPLQEWGEQIKGANEVFGNEKSPGPLVNVRGVDSPLETQKATEEMEIEIKNTRTYKEKFEGRSPNDYIQKKTKSVWNGMNICQD